MEPANEVLAGEVQPTKECTRCHRVLPQTNFYKRSASPDGLQDWCKSCQNGIRVANRAAQPEQSLSSFTPRELIAELRRRGYTGELKFVQRIKV